MHVSTATLDSINELYGQGRYLAAWEVAQSLGPLNTWTGPRGRVLAGRLASNLGGDRLARVLLSLAQREYPDEEEPRYFNALRIAARRGPLRAWQWMNCWEPPCADQGTLRADWFSLGSRLLAELRDFERAHQWFEQARSLAPDRAWIWIERSGALSAEDRHNEALECTRKAFALRPWYRPAVQALVSDLVQVGRDDEALELLRGAITRLESGNVLAQLVMLEMELGQHTEAREHAEQIPRLLPLADGDKVCRQWLIGLRADAAYYCGDLQTALELMESADNPFRKKMVERLRDPALAAETAARKLDVTFVRQHHVTCAPATLTALARYWNKPVDHVDVAERICYNGTPGHAERNWAEVNGWLAREFRVTWDTSVALIDRGVPFTLTTVYPGSAHLQGVIGYDARRGTLLVREPSERVSPEFNAEAMLEVFQATGPRGMLMVPSDRADLLDGLSLPDAELYDLLYRLDRAIAAHQRDEAHEALRAMRELDPNHRLTIHARGQLAWYDADLEGMLTSTRQLLQQFPDDVNLLLTEIRLLSELGRRDERIARLEELCARPATDGLFIIRLAEELVVDARQYSRVEGLLRRAMRYRPMDATAAALRADLWWSTGRRDAALELYRLASTLDDRDEARAWSYLQAARCLRRTDEALRMLHDRFQRFGRLSGRPAMTLCRALDQMDRTEEMRQVLQQALALRGDDGDLLLFATEMHTTLGERAEAARLLERARGLAHHTSWLRSSAHLALVEGDLRQGLACWKQVLDAEPLAGDANDMVAQLLADLEGIPTVLEHVRAKVSRFPHSYTLRSLLQRWLRHEPLEVGEQAVREMTELFPADPWAHRELANMLRLQGQLDEARSELDLAEQLDPATPVVHCMRGVLFADCGQWREARAAYRRSIELAVDYDDAVWRLLDVCQSKAERVAELEFLAEQLRRQVTFGDGLLTFVTHATPTLDDEQVEQVLREAHEARPDLWHAWAALERHLVRRRKLDEALAVGRAAVERFPLLPRLWFDLADVYQAMGDGDEEIRAVERAVELNPSWSYAVRRLADAWQRAGELERAQTQLEQLIAREPQSGVNHGFLASVLWDMQRRDEALAHIRTAVKLDPHYGWAWQQLRFWAGQLDRYDEAIESAEQLAQTRADEPESWMVLADTVSDTDRRLEAYDRALALNPRMFEAHDQKAATLAELGRFDEALAACSPPVPGDERPLFLRGRAADIEAERGNHLAAIEQMLAVVAEDPDYRWGWYRLSDWFFRTRDSRLLESAEQLVRLAPDNAMSWGYLGGAEWGFGDLGRAIEALEQSLRLDPEYPYAANSLATIYLENQRFDEFHTLLKRMEPHVSPAQLHAWRARQGVVMGSAKAVQSWASKLAAADPPEWDLLREVCEAVDQSPQTSLRRGLLDALNDRTTDVRTPTELITLAMEMGVRWKQWSDCRKLLNRFPKTSEAWDTAVFTWLQQLDRHGHTGRLNWFMFWNRRAIIRMPAACGQAALVLLGRNEFRRILPMYEGWRQRTDWQPRHFLGFFLALLHLDRLADAFDVYQHLKDRPADYANTYLELWLAAAYAAIRRWGEADIHFQRVDPREFDEGFYPGFYRFVQLALQIVAEHRDGSRNWSPREARQALVDCWEEIPVASRTSGDPPLVSRIAPATAMEVGGASLT